MRRLLPVIDHGCLAAASLLVTVLAARNLPVAQFAAFAALQLVVFLIVGAFRAGPGGWIVVADPRTSLEKLGTGLAVIAVALGVASSVVVVVVCIVLGLPWDTVFWTTAYLTLLLLVDALRFRCYRAQEVASASVLSAGALIVLLAMALVIRPTGISGILAVAGAAYGVVALSASLALTSRRAAVDGVHLVLRCGREMGKGTLKGYMGLSAFRLGAPIAMSFTGGPVMLASFRGAQTLASLPLQIPESLRLPYLVRGTRLHQTQGDLPVAYRRSWPLMLCAVLGPCLVLAVVVPDALGEAVLGDTWRVAKTALPFILIGAFFNQLTVGIELVARIKGGVEHVARVRVWAGVVGLPVVALAARSGLAAAMGAYSLVCLATWVVARAGDPDGGVRQ